MIPSINLALRFMLELAVLASLGYWGFHLKARLFIKIVLGFGIPMLAAVIWAIYGAPGSVWELRASAHLLLELVIFGSAAAAIYVSGYRKIAIAFVLIVLLNRLLMFIWEQ